MWRCLYGVSGCRFTCALAYYSRGHIGFFKRYDVRNGEYTTRLREHGLRVCWFWRWYCCRCIARRLSLPCDCAYAALPSAGLCAFERLLLPLASRFVCLAPVLLRRRGGLRHQWFHAVRDACERLRSSNAARCCAKLVCRTSAGSAPASGCCTTISLLGTCCVTARSMRDACFVKKGEGLGARQHRFIVARQAVPQQADTEQQHLALDSACISLKYTNLGIKWPRANGLRSNSWCVIQGLPFGSAPRASLKLSLEQA